MAESISKAQTSSQTKPLARYNLDGKIVKISYCSYEDIPVHAERVSSFWSDPDINEVLMMDAVDNQCAWKLDDLCFLYTIPFDKELCGVAFWCKLKIHAVIGYMFIRDHTRYNRVYWNPHQKHKSPFTFMLDNRTIADFWNVVEFIGIRIPSTQMEHVRIIQLLKHSVQEI